MKPLLAFALGLATAIAAMIVAAMFVPVNLAGASQVIELRYRTGGNMLDHIVQAQKWKRQGVKLVVADYQLSAAAVQVAWYKANGGSVCYGKKGFNANPMLYFHQALWTDRNGVKHYDDSVKRYARSLASKIGPVPVKGWRKVHPSHIGIPACGPYKADKRTKAAPSIWRP